MTPGRSTASPLPANNPGPQVVHTRALSPGSINWYRPNRWERQYMEDVWPAAHVTELCLQLTAGSGPGNGDEHRPYSHRAVREHAEYG